MALNAYLYVEGDTQGQIAGSSTRAGREGLIEVYGFSHEVVSPRDAASGLPTGKRQHKPLTVTKEIDKASPLLMNVLVNNENVTAYLELYRVSETGAEEHYYTIELTNATVADVRTEQLNNKYVENANLGAREHISFVYQSIAWTYEPEALAATDRWQG